MLIVILTAVCLIALTTLIHYEFLRGFSARLPALLIPSRTKLLVVVFGMFLAHALEIAVYGIALLLLLKHAGVGTLTAPGAVTLTTCLYFSAETYTSLGFGDVTPLGPVRLLSGVETLNGLLLIGWSASYLYIAMERFWSVEGDRDRHA